LLYVWRLNKGLCLKQRMCSSQHLPTQATSTQATGTSSIHIQNATNRISLHTTALLAMAYQWNLSKNILTRYFVRAVALRHYVTKRKAAGSIPDEIFEIFHWSNSSDRTTPLWLNQPQREIRTSHLLWRLKVVDAYGWKPCHLHVLIENPGEPKPRGALGAYLGLYRNST
jgi:hypothetical protein